MWQLWGGCDGRPRPAAALLPGSSWEDSRAPEHRGNARGLEKGILMGFSPSRASGRGAISQALFYFSPALLVGKINFYRFWPSLGPVVRTH